MYFTILDFRNASRLFADPAFDGEPIVVYEAKENDPIPENNDIPNAETEQPATPIDFADEEIETRHIYRVNGVQVDVVSERVQYYDVNGKLITESLKDYTKRNILSEYKTLDDFLTKWTGEEKSSAIIEELKEQGILLDALREESGQKEIDDFDLICHIAFDKKPLTKSERIKRAKQKPYFEKYSEAAQKVLSTLLDKYASNGAIDFEDLSVLRLKEFHDFGSLAKIIALFNGKENYLQAVRDLRKILYAA